MLSSCAVPDKYGANRTISGNSELNAVAEEYWDRYLCKKGESSFLKFDDPFIK